MGMDWLSSCYANVDFLAKIVRFHFPNKEVIEWKWCTVLPVGKFVSYLKAKRMMSKGCLAYLAHIVDIELEALILQYVPIVKEFPEVFPDDLPGLPLERVIDFGIDVRPNTQPISIQPYILVVIELNEFKE